jgi:hypothetical protein
MRDFGDDSLTTEGRALRDALMVATSANEPLTQAIRAAGVSQADAVMAKVWQLKSPKRNWRQTEDVVSLLEISKIFPDLVQRPPLCWPRRPSRRSAQGSSLSCMSRRGLVLCSISGMPVMLPDRSSKPLNKPGKERADGNVNIKQRWRLPLPLILSGCRRPKAAMAETALRLVMAKALLRLMPTTPTLTGRATRLAVKKVM